MFSFCANYSYLHAMPMMMPFGTCCRGGGNNFMSSFVGAFMGASMAGSGSFPLFNNSYYYGAGYPMQPLGGYQPVYSPMMQPYMPIFSAQSMMPSFNFTMPQMAVTPTFDASSFTPQTFAPFTQTFTPTSSFTPTSTFSTGGSEANDPFAAPVKKTTGKSFDSDAYLKGTSVPEGLDAVRKLKGRKDLSAYNVSTLPQLVAVGYNAEKGARLAKEALAGVTGFDGACGTKVREAMERANLDNGKRTGSAADFGDVLFNQKNFKEISTKGLDLSALPKGCALVYGRGVAGYSSEDGHVEITLGDGRAASDGITNNIRPGARVFVPV